MGYGDAQVYGKARILNGVKITHKNQVVTLNHLQWDITATPDYIKIGCETHTFEQWMKNYKAIGKKNNLDDSEIDNYRVTIKYLQSQIIKGVNKNENRNKSK